MVIKLNIISVLKKKCKEHVFDTRVLVEKSCSFFFLQRNKILSRFRDVHIFLYSKFAMS